MVDAPSDAPVEVLAHFGQTTESVERKECNVNVRTVSNLGIDGQASLNATVGNWSAQQILRNFGASGEETVAHSYNWSIDGVQVARVSFDYQNGEQSLRFYSQQFLLMDGAARLYQLDCFITDAGSTASDVEALLGSVRISQESLQ